MTAINTYDMYIDQVYAGVGLEKIKRITANIPEALLREATAVTGASLTETIIQGLKLVKRAAAYNKAQALKGKLNLELDLEVSRERSDR